MGIVLRRLARRTHLLGLCTGLLLVGVLVSATALAQPDVSAHAWASVPADAACARLASMDRSATNGASWGITLLAGHNAPGGWFGVDVCGNGINQTAPGGANLSCDHIPANLARTGCAPGRATYDGFGLSFQCVELVARFAAWAFNDQPSDWRGNAPDLWVTGNHPRDFSAVPNGGTQAPVPGDILVWGTVNAQGQPWPDGPADGHVAVVSAVKGGQLTFVEENALAGGRNIPSETTSLRRDGSHWTVGSGARVPSGARALYGWLHSSRNTGNWTGQRSAHGAHGAPPSSGAASPTPTTADTTRQLPTLAQGVVVANTGALADLVWTSASSQLSPAGTAAAPPHVMARSLGAPADSQLAPGQTPVVLSGAADTRTVYALGTDGALYAARTAPGMLGVLWQSLGSPDGQRLVGSPAASDFAGGVQVAALDGSGHLWWRGGPASNLGGWLDVGAPASTALTALWLAGAPGSGLPLAVGLGADGHLYMARWADGGTDSSGAASGWGDWTKLALPGLTGPLTGPLVGVNELATSQDTVGRWADTPLDLLVSDQRGTLRLVRLPTSGVWHVQSLWASAPLTRLISAAAVTASSTSAALLHVYATDAAGLKLGEVTINTAAGTAATHWESLTGSGQSTGGATANGSRAIAFGDDESLLVVPGAPDIQLDGPADAIQAALPGAKPDQQAGQAQTSTSGAVGAVTGGLSFADPFSSVALDPRWVSLDAPSQPTYASGKLALPPAASPDAALLLQRAPAGDTTLETTVTLPAAAPTSLRAGLALYLDAGDWLTLTLGGDGHLTFCTEAWAAPAKCQSASAAAAGASARSAVLKLTRTRDTFAAFASGDGQRWSQVGTWTPVLPAGIQPALASDSTAPGAQSRDTGAASGQPAVRVTAPLAFTGAGLIAAQDGAAASGSYAWPRFAYFSVAAGNQ